MAPDETPGNPLGKPPPPVQGPIPAPGKEPKVTGEGSPAGGSPVDNGQPASEPPAPSQGVPDIPAALALMSSTVEGITVELGVLAKKQRGVERQIIMLFGVLAVIAWKSGQKAAKQWGGPVDVTPGA